MKLKDVSCLQTQKRSTVKKSEKNGPRMDLAHGQKLEVAFNDCQGTARINLTDLARIKIN